MQVNSSGLIEILSPADHDVRSLQHISMKDTWSASFHRDGHRNVAVGNKSGNVKIWDTKNKTITKTFPAPSQPSCVTLLSYNAKNTSLAATMVNGDTTIYGLVSNIPVLTVKLTCSKSISAMKFHHESRSLLGLATDEGHVVLRDITTNKDKAFFENIHASPVSDFSFSIVNKDVMLSSGYDKIIQVYDIRMQNVVSTVKTTYTLTSLTINSENQIALGTKSGHVLIYDLRDFSGPYKVLKGHEEEVSKVAFQPARRKTLSNELSLREDVETTSHLKAQSPVKTRTSDVFFMNDTPPKNNLDTSGFGAENKADSFLVMLGLDKTNNDFEEDANKSTEYERKSDKHEVKYRHLDAEKNLNKISTPLNSRTPENLGFPSPLCLPNGIDEKRNSNTNLSNIKQINPNNNAPNIDTNVVDELKDFIKLSLSYIAVDNKNYFLHIMMNLTKQKLFLEKQLSALNQQVQILTQNQTALMEANRKLTLQIDQLKQNSF